MVIIDCENHNPGWDQMSLKVMTRQYSYPKIEGYLFIYYICLESSLVKAKKQENQK